MDCENLYDGLGGQRRPRRSSGDLGVLAVCICLFFAPRYHNHALPGRDGCTSSVFLLAFETLCAVVPLVMDWIWLHGEAAAEARRGQYGHRHWSLCDPEGNGERGKWVDDELYDLGETREGTKTLPHAPRHGLD